MPPPASKLREVPAILDAAIARCMRRNPEERFPNVLELAQAIAPIRPGSDAAVARIAAVMARPKTNLTDASTGLTAVEPPPHATHVAWADAPAGRANRRAMGLGVAAAVAVLVVVALVFTLQKRPKARVAASAPATNASDVMPLPMPVPPLAQPAPATSQASAAGPLPEPPAPQPSSLAADPVDDPSAAAGPTGSAARSPPRPGYPHPKQPSKQDLLKDRR